MAMYVSQVNDNFIARDKGMAAYVKLVIDLFPSFKNFELAQIPCIENAHANALSKLTNNKDSDLLTVVSKSISRMLQY